MDILLGWQTDLAVLRLGGSSVDSHDDHLIVRTPDNPDFHWGNFVFALRDVDDAARWPAVFDEALPEATYRAIGLAADTVDDVWAAAGLRVERDDVLAADHQPAAGPLPATYEVRQLRTAADWLASTALRQAEYDEESAYAAGMARGRARMAEAGHTAWFGAFAGDRLAAELGIVDCGDGLARYQSVLTDAAHRRRGLTSHLLGVAADWSRHRGCRRWVIVADDGSAANRLYRQVSFTPTSRKLQVYGAASTAG